MAISHIEFNFLYEAFRRGLLGSRDSILEFGEAELFFDPAAAVPLLVPEKAPREALLAEARGLAGTPYAPYAGAQLIYRILFGNRSYNSIDLLPAEGHRFQQDLNQPFDLGRRFDVCINNGTSEHVFNQANFYKAIHDHTSSGGLMVHWTPCLGWVNHGMFNVQPGFFGDLAAANEYEILLGALCSKERMIGLTSDGIDESLFAAQPDLRDSLACAILRKTSDKPFRLPMQGSYSYLSRS
jgi:hypothetical protein